MHTLKNDPFPAVMTTRTRASTHGSANPLHNESATKLTVLIAGRVMDCEIRGRVRYREWGVASEILWLVAFAVWFWLRRSISHVPAFPVSVELMCPCVAHCPYIVCYIECFSIEGLSR